MIRGHVWTIGRHLLVAGTKAPPSEPFRLTLRDERFGQVELHGQFDPAPRARELVVLVHGLGGCSESSYLVAAVRRCRRLGLSCLRLDLRGADLRGEDMYHAGLSRDLHAVLTDPRFDGYERRYLWGYSLGGHVCLRYAADYAPGDVDAVAAITAPLDLDAGAAVFDSRTNPLYRRYVMAALLRMYRAFVARRGPWPLPLEQAERLTRIRDFDDAIVAPRHGFADASDYYVRASVSHVLHRITTRALLVHTRHDPMVPSESVQPLLHALPGTLSALLVDQGGHVAFPRSVDLGQPGALGLEEQVLTWLRRKRGEA